MCLVRCVASSASVVPSGERVQVYQASFTCYSRWCIKGKQSFFNSHSQNTV